MTVYALGDTTPKIDKTAYVAPGVFIVGDVTLQQNANVWFGATLRADNASIVIGAGSNIQENSVLHVDPGFDLTIGADVTVGHQAMLHGCTIGEGSLIGIQAIVLNGAKIGKGCLIGAGALITEGKEIPDGSLVMGSPGKVVRQLEAKDIERLRMSAVNYVTRAAQYRNELRALTEAGSDTP